MTLHFVDLPLRFGVILLKITVRRQIGRGIAESMKHGYEKILKCWEAVKKSRKWEESRSKQDAHLKTRKKNKNPDKNDLETIIYEVFK